MIQRSRFWLAWVTFACLSGCPRQLDDLLCDETGACAPDYVCQNDVCVRRDEVRADAGLVRRDAGPHDSGAVDAGAEPEDAGGDGGGEAHDAGEDAGADGGPDAGVDAGRDAGVDAGPMAPSPVLAFSFDELFGAAARDGVGGVDAPREDGAMFVLDGRHRGGLDLTGGRLDIDYQGQIGVGYMQDVTTLSVCLWLKTPTPNNGDWQVAYQVGGSTKGLVLGLNANGQPAAAARSSTPVMFTLLEGDNPVVPDTWTHLCAVFDQGDFRLLADAQEVAADTAVASTFNTGVVGQGLGRIAGLGSTFTGINPAPTFEQFGGLVDDVMLFDVGVDELTAGLLMNTPAAAPGPALALSFDDAAAGMAQSTGLESLGFTVTAPTAPGHTLLAVRIDNDGHYAHAGYGNSGSLVQSNSERTTVTMMAWAKSNEVPTQTNPRTVFQVGGAANCVAIGLTPDDDVYFQSRRTGLESRVTSPLMTQADGWVHIAGVRDGTAMELYINGELANGALDADPWGTGTGVGINIGVNEPPGTSEESCYSGDHIMDNALSEWFDGVIDDARLYAYALTPEEIVEAMGTPVD